jgi:hypothetical protein
MLRQRGSRRFDLFSLVLALLAIGLSVTLAYQITVYYGDGPLPIARQAPPPPAVGG